MADTVDAGTLAFGLTPSASDTWGRADNATVNLTLGISGVDDYRPAIYAFVASATDKWGATVTDDVRFRVSVKEDRWIARIFGEG